ncbi:DUF433 domain-containing protein [Hymenobacter sp. DH14]|uniref:DUF433 domain-containing protein n=1 Tax=Hymenobacter cyanobacteriorum TaxID=2926463 RepID=A0A9X1VEY8_9BACT|nr:DUF433 domain-containing protein [Hymenobacter cyanobacteriorum]MCI1187919.1 DUF433 domain-containing protein [Hymenobacter cyanobacteriorum]
MPGSSRITVHPAICDGQPTVRGLRVPVWQVLEWLATGRPESEIITAHPGLEPEDFRACLAFAAQRLKPLARTQPAAPDQNSEAWLLSRQSQWLAEQEFLKQLWERRAMSGQPVVQAG